MIFKKKYLVIKKVITKDMADFIYGYFSMKRRVAKKFLDDRYYFPLPSEWGYWKDVQIPNTYSHYADMVMETLLEKVRPKMEKETKLKLVPTYSYARIYKKGDILPRHKDRSGCEISTTMFLGGDPWSIYLEPNKNVCIPPDSFVPTKNKGIKVDIKQGDMLVYRGCELEHWRTKFKGKDCAQVFLHYNNKKTPGSSQNLFDERPHLGLPSWFKKVKLPSPKK